MLEIDLSPLNHQHTYVDGGTIFSDGGYSLPGSGATRRYYGSLYFCQGCLNKQIERISTGDENSYMPIKYGARPATEQERQLLVPESDRSRMY